MTEGPEVECRVADDNRGSASNGMGRRRERRGPGSGSKQGTVADYVQQNRLNPELVERIRRLVIEHSRR